MPIELPLFPLGTVLFPHMPMALHIFEERYREMMRLCLSTGITFGVVAIAEGTEVGGAAVPYRVGTLAQLRDVEELPDGRYNLLVVGASRFQVDSLSHQRPYLMGAIHYLEDAPDEPGETAALAGRVRQAFVAYAATLRGDAPAGTDAVELPDDPELLAYVVAASLQVETARRQALLEVDGAAARLRACLAVLRREAALQERMLSRPRHPAEVASLN